MDLLKDSWIPVRPLAEGGQQWIGLEQLLTEAEQRELCLPRDDLELAALQLLICMSQLITMPTDLAQLRQRAVRPLTAAEYAEGIEPVKNWFRLDHPEHPFMQVRAVAAKDVTPMDKLLAGLTGSTNSCFVNQPGLAEGICPGCAAIALFNQANNAPSFGGGFKAGLRGGAPITTLIQGRHLRETLWLNVLARDQLPEFLVDNLYSLPTWVDPIMAQSSIPAASLGLARGLLWQPAHVELRDTESVGCCSCCGRLEQPLYHGFRKAKFNYSIDGLWPHPHSPRLQTFAKGDVQQKFAAFTTTAPSWTRLTGFVVQLQADKTSKAGYQPAEVVLQAQKLARNDRQRLRLVVGGYRNNQASILERRHDLLELGAGWQQDPLQVKELVDLGLGYKSALRKALFLFATGVKDIKGAGVAVQETGERHFYRRSDGLMQSALANTRFDNHLTLGRDKISLRAELRQLCLDLFEQETRPYRHDPPLIHTLAVARRTLHKHLKNQEPEAQGEPA